MTKEQLLEKANDLPLAPGVLSDDGRIGQGHLRRQGKKLKNRVSQYFQLGTGHNRKDPPHGLAGRPFRHHLVSSEFEALILENPLIKQHQPHYDILLKDDEGYPFVRLCPRPPARTRALPTKRRTTARATSGPSAHAARPAPGRRRGLRRLPPADLHAPVPARHREGAPLPRLPHGPLRRLLPPRAGRERNIEKRIEQACSLLAGRCRDATHAS